MLITKIPGKDTDLKYLTSVKPKHSLYLYMNIKNFPDIQFSSVQFSSVPQSRPTLCDPMNHSTSGLPVHYQLPEFTQTHVHRIRDAIQPSHPLSSPSPTASNPPSIRVFSNGTTLRMRWPKYWSFSISISPSNEHPGLISLGWTGWISLWSKRPSRIFFNNTVQKYQLFSAQVPL